jgi:hypothetical protein
MEMGLKKTLKYYILGESLKEIEANRILDKISKKKSLSDREKRFLELYNHKSEETPKDHMYLSKNTTFERVRNLLDTGKSVICDLSDRNGKIGLQILSIENVHSEDDCTIFMKGDETYKLQDRFLYNIIYNQKLNKYSLQEQGEYYEKIEQSNED